ncbi:MAG TPA: outer membrane protein assembly factor BamC [Gallionellaceae bacterium]
MKVSNFSALTLLACALAACSSTSDEQNRVDYKAAAIKVRSLEVPPDLTAPVGNDRYGIPGAEGVARYSDYSRGQAGGGGSTVLPEARNVRLMRDGAQRWLVVNDKPENIWPLVKAFWQENGLAIKIDNPAAGIMETDWAENRAKTPSNGKRTLFGKLFDSSNSSGERDQYHTRLERRADGSTEIYIKHNGLQEVKENNPDSYVASYKWLPRASDPELEATMLQMLMARLSGASPRSDAGDAAQKPATVAAAQLLTAADGSKRVQLSEPFDKSWRKVSLALEQAKLTLEDKDRSKGVFYLRSSKGAADGSALQVNLKENATGCEVTVTDGKGVVTPDAQRILETLYPILTKL